MRKQGTTNPRFAALQILEHLNHSPKTLDVLLDKSASELTSLSRKDRGLFNQLVYGVLRWRLRLDSVVASFSKRSLTNIDPSILNILRIGLFQILFLDRIPPSAAVNTAVALAKKRKHTKAAGFVNALLRNVLRHPDRFKLPDPHDDPVASISLTYSFPQWLVSRWVHQIGIEETQQRCNAMNVIPPITIRCNGLVNGLPELKKEMSDQVEGFDELKNVPGAMNLKRPLGPIPEMKAFIEGRFAVQDGAAQLVPLLLDPQPGETVLDACSGLGGKTTHLAQIMKNRGTLIAMDNVPAKLTLLEKEASRLKISTIQTSRTDLNRPIDPGTKPRFDRILLDAPCSGLGVLRRNPDAKWSSKKKDIVRCASRQERFLNHLAPLVKKAGTLVYAVCSLEPEENEQVIRRFLKNHSNFVIKNNQSAEKETVSAFLTEEGFFKTAPHLHGMDGFFAARLRRVK